MLRQLRLSKRLEFKKKELKSLDFGAVESRKKELAKKREELSKEIDSADSQKLDEIETELDSLETEEKKTEEIEKELEEKKELLEEEIEEIEKELEEIQNVEPKQRKKHTDVKKEAELRSINEYLHSKGTKRGGFVSEDGEVIIPVDASHKPKMEPHDVVDLAKLVNVESVKSASGIWPVQKTTSAKMHTVKELEKNPTLAKPDFTKVSYEIKTYRGAIPISQEAIDDAEVDLIEIIQKHIKSLELNTKNDAICNILKKFPKKTITSVDEIKRILNVELPQVYKRGFLITASFYQKIDTLKDKNGRYLFQESITSATGYTFLGREVKVVDDELLGKNGEAIGFLGDLKAAITLFDRMQIGARWVNSEIYGQYLQGGMRMDVKTVDEKAGYLISAESLVLGDEKTEDVNK